MSGPRPRSQLASTSTSPADLGAGVPASSALASEAGDGSSGAASYSYLGSMWTGLMRRFSSEDRQLDPQLDAPSHPTKDGVNGVFTPAFRRASPFRPPPLDPLVLHGYRDGTPASARLLTSAVAEEVRAMVPERLRIAENWRLVYSLEQDGASLATLYQMCRRFEGRRAGFVLVVRDQEGGVRLDAPHPHSALHLRRGAVELT